MQNCIPVHRNFLFLILSHVLFSAFLAFLGTFNEKIIVNVLRH